MIECRRIKEWDVDALVRYAIEGMRAERYPLHVSESKVRQWVRMFMPEDTPHFGLAAFNGSDLVGAIALFVNELPFFERHEGSVVLCRATEPGAGRRLVRLMMEWVRSNMAVRRVIFPLEEGHDSRQALLLRHFGFTHEQTNLIYYKG